MLPARMPLLSKNYYFSGRYFFCFGFSPDGKVFIEDEVGLDFVGSVPDEQLGFFFTFLNR